MLLRLGHEMGPGMHGQLSKGSSKTFLCVCCLFLVVNNKQHTRDNKHTWSSVSLQQLCCSRELCWRTRCEQGVLVRHHVVGLTRRQLHQQRVQHNTLAATATQHNLCNKKNKKNEKTSLFLFSSFCSYGLFFLWRPVGQRAVRRSIAFPKKKET
jgi:hypothetical protein